MYNSPCAAKAARKEQCRMIPLMLDDKYETMPWDMIDTVLFDVGNVLLTYDPDAIIRDLVPDRPDLYERLRTKVFRTPYWPMMDHGLATAEQAAEAMIGRDKDLAPYVHAIMNGWIEMKDVISEGVDALKTVKAHGKRLYVLSNYPDKAFQHIYDKYDFFKLFDDVVVSARIGLTKPNPEIYRYVLKKYALDPARTLFIDDTHNNIEAALALGIQGICKNRPGKLRDFFV